jgi:TolB-like protein/DNA-binding winged helix-turn-helix (wHTH) protein/Tfp pilus assembly protein PilF
VTFDRFEVDLRSGELRKDGRKVRLPAQPFQLLTLLIENAGEVVTRDEVCRALWQTDTFVDFDHSVAAAVNKIREALGDSAENPRFVETLPRKGYRFIRQIKRDLPQVATLPTAAEVPRASPRTAKLPASWLKTIGWVGVGVVALLCTLGWRMARYGRVGFSSGSQIRSLAVLPLANLSGEADREYFADGMTEELTTDLGKISALRVISRTSTMQYKGSKKPLPEIARELNVDAIVEGTVARSGSHVHITANLIQASPERHLWAESYESEVADALAVQGEIAQAVGRKIGLSITEKERELLTVPRPVNPEAQDLYMEGRFAWHFAENAEASQKAVNYFQRAIERDSSFAKAYAALASVYAVWIPGMAQGPRDHMPKAREFAMKALALDNTISESHSTLGMIDLFYDWNWSAAEEEYKQTIALNPNYFWVHSWHARELVARGQTVQAVAEAQRVIGLSPSPLNWDYPIWVFVLARRGDLARERAEQLLRVAPQWTWAHFSAAYVYDLQGDSEKAAQEFLKADELFETEPRKMAQLKEAFAKSGAQGYWRRTVENYKETAKSNYVAPVLVAEACVRIGDKECAFKWLEKGFEERDDLMINLKVEPVLDSLHSDPRFQDLVRRVGIPQ